MLLIRRFIGAAPALSSGKSESISKYIIFSFFWNSPLGTAACGPRIFTISNFSIALGFVCWIISDIIWTEANFLLVFDFSSKIGLLFEG